LCISVRNPLDHVEVREKIIIETDTEPTRPPDAVGKHSHEAHPEPVCHFSLKWDGASQRSTIQVLDHVANVPRGTKGRKNNNNNNNNNNSAPRDMTAKDSGEFVPMLALDCLGLEPYAFHPMGNEFVVTNKAGVTFNKVDLSKGFWSEYELGAGSTTIENFVTKFV
jgi:Eukaryotic protein of unknown function (DUF866)